MQDRPKSTMLCLSTLLQAVLLVMAALSGVHGLGLQDPSATSELQQGHQDDSHAVEDPVSLSAEIQDLDIARRNLLWRRWRRRGTAANANADAVAAGVGGNSVANTNTGTLSFANSDTAVGAGFANSFAKGDKAAFAASGVSTSASA